MSTKSKQLYRSRDDRMIAGVCGGLGDYFDIDPTIIRLLFVFGAFATGSGLVMMVVVPEETLASEAVVAAVVEDVQSEETE